jgi:hypothetical protein
VKIDVLVPSRFSIHDFAGQLGLKDGQKIIGRIVGSGQGEVLLQLAGKTVVAKLEGEPVPQGSLLLLGVSLPQGDRIELKVMENLSQPAGGGTDIRLPDSAGDPQFRALISAALKEFGLNDSASNIEKVVSVIKEFESQYQLLLAPKVFTFLLGKNWPVTPGTVLFSWLYQDEELRGVLWNLLNRSLWVRDNPALLSKVFDLGEEAPAFPTPDVNPASELSGPDELVTVQTGKEGGSGGTSPTVPSETGVLQPSQVLSEGQELQNPENKSEYSLAEIEKFKTVLEQSLRLEQAGNEKNQINGGETIIPFLVRTPKNTLREYIVKWNEKSSHTDGGEKEESVRVVIPTENMGDITLQMLLSSKGVRIGLKVMSAPVKNYITRHLSDLRTTVGPEARIAVSTVATKSETESRMDLWM